ncbi:MAG: DNA primase [Armatimonadota bacterium]|nr:DNA primase [Armatimonadota bacterium]
MDFDDTKEEIRERLDLAEVIGQYVRLERAGSRLKGLCPFHQEKTPSFYVDPERGFWHCFGCGEGGDLFSFVMRQEGLSFPEAMRMLARRAGVSYRADPQADARRERREILERANEIARDHFVKNLLEHPEAERARDYLRERSFNRSAIDSFQIGYALESWDDLLNTLAAQGINAALAEEAGLAKASDRGGHYDTFRNRIIFPINDLSGRPIAFGGRTLDPENPAKYLNSPETPLFRKRRALYALDLARDAIVAEKRALIVEGYTDVIALHQAGLRNVVAGLGTALTKQQLDLVGRYADEVVLVYDADAAGARAALRNLEVFEGSDVAVSLIVLPENMDPDEFVKTHGVDAFRDLLQERISPIEYELRAAFERHAADGPTGRSAAVHDAVEVLMKIQDWTARDEYLRRAVDFWAEGDSVLGESVQRAIKLEFGRRSRKDRRTQRADGGSDSSYISETLSRPRQGLLRTETELLAQAFDDQELARTLVAELQPGDMILETDAVILEAVGEQMAERGRLDVDALIEALPEAEGVRKRCVELTVTEVRPSRREDEEIRSEQIQQMIGRLKMHRRSGGADPLIAPVADGGSDMSVEDFRELERQVQAGINSGELTPDDTVVKLYYETCRRLRGSGGRGYIGDGARAPRPGAEARPDHSRQRPEPGDEEQTAPAEDAVAPEEDEWAIEEGDPFSLDE